MIFFIINIFYVKKISKLFWLMVSYCTAQRSLCHKWGGEKGLLSET